MNQCQNIDNCPLGTNFSEILIEIYTFSFKKMQLKILSGKWRPFCLGLNELKTAMSRDSKRTFNRCTNVKCSLVILYLDYMEM